MNHIRCQKIAVLVCAPPMLALAACGGAEPAEVTDEAAEFAARINGTGNGTAQPPTGNQPLPIAPQRDTPQKSTYNPEPKMASQGMPCDATAMGQFLGRVADDATRQEVLRVAAGAIDVQFVAAESGYIEPNPANPRIHMMLDRQGVIRDALCR